MKKDPEALSPEKIWKHTVDFRRASKGKTSDAVMVQFFKDKVSGCELVDVPCLACIRLFKALNTACYVPTSDFRCCMETALEFATIPDIVRAISFVLNIDIELPSEKTMSKGNFLRKCIDALHLFC